MRVRSGADAELRLDAVDGFGKHGAMDVCDGTVKAHGAYEEIADGWNDVIVAGCGVIAEVNFRPSGETAVIVLKDFQEDRVECLAVGSTPISSFVET